MNTFYSFAGSVFLLLIIVHARSLQAQQTAPVNLVYNGNFSQRNTGFHSDYRYDEFVSPGSYAITRDASLNNPELSNPLYGDHTKGTGYFLVANADGSVGKKIWCGQVKVQPNTRYEFSAYFCNVYALLPPKSNFAMEEGDVKGNDPELKVTIGSEVIALEKDFYHLFRWVRITGTWYSGGHARFADICIENTNRSVNGNDVALDDISFTYLETMPEGYEPPKKTVTLVDRYYVKPQEPSPKVALSTYGEFEFNDTITEGVYVLHPKPWRPIRVEEEPVFTDTNRYERITLKHLIFDQTKAELKESAKKELDLVVAWMLRDTQVRVRFIGHTDNQGDPVLNLKLSEQRVWNVKAYLVSQGIASDRIETVGYGGSYPIGDNSREDSRKWNRRVEMEILSK